MAFNIATNTIKQIQRIKEHHRINSSIPITSGTATCHQHRHYNSMYVIKFQPIKEQQLPAIIIASCIPIK